MGTHDKTCNTCGDSNEQCSSETCDGPQILAQNQFNDIKNVIAVMSGKGGVGKSAVSGLLAVSLAREGNRVGILDADITGPSIPKMFGISERPHSMDEYLLPVSSPVLGIEIMSLNLLLPNEDDPVIWRGPIIAGAVKQFWSEVAWGKLDYLIVDLPPGTGDVPLTVMQSLPLNGVLIVTSPQDLATMVVRKAIKMINQMNVPIVGMVENMSYLICDHCGKKLYPFGSSHREDVVNTFGVQVLKVLPIDPLLAELCDTGRVEDYQGEAFAGIYLPGVKARAQTHA